MTNSVATNAVEDPIQGAAPVTAPPATSPAKKKKKKLHSASSAAPAAPAKGATKKSAAPAKTNSAPAAEELFRAGSTKAGIWNKLKGGKTVAIATLKTFVEAEGKSHQLIAWVLKKAGENGYKITRDAEKGTVSVISKRARD